jgi:hypothetical protein
MRISPLSCGPKVVNAFQLFVLHGNFVGWLSPCPDDTARVEQARCAVSPLIRLLDHTHSMHRALATECTPPRSMWRIAFA